MEFDTDASSLGTYDIISGGVLNAAVLADAIADVNALSAGGSTNYEAGLQQALPFIQGVPSQTINVTDLISSYDANSNGGSGNTDTARIIGNGSTQIALVSGWTSPGTTNGQLVDVENNTGDVDDGWGVQGGSSDEDVNTTELLRFDFGSFNNFGVADYTSGGFAGMNVVSATFTLDDNNGGGSTNFGYTIHFVGGATQSGSTSINNVDTNITLLGTGGNAGLLIDYIEFSVTGAGALGDIDLQSVVTPAVLPGTLPNADVNSLIFISDGEPNTANNDGGTPFSVNAQNAIDQILGVDDSTNEVGQTETDGDGVGPDQAFTIEAFHVGSPTVTLTVDDADDNDDANAASGSSNDDDVVVLSSNGVDVAQVSGWSSASLALTALVDANGGTGGLGVEGGADGSQLDASEVLRFDFGAGTDFDGAGTNYSTLGFNGPPVSSATFEFDSFGGGSHAVAYRGVLQQQHLRSWLHVGCVQRRRRRADHHGAAGPVHRVHRVHQHRFGQRPDRPAVGRHAESGACAARPGRGCRRQCAEHHCAGRSLEQPERAGCLAGRHAG